jgi:hypothetical protein
MAVDDIQNSENLLNLSQQILNSLNERAASQQKLSKDEKEYASALKKSQEISDAIVSNQIKSKDLTKKITESEKNLGQIIKSFGNIEKTLQENRKASLLKIRKLAQEERNITQEAINLNQQLNKLELDKQSILQDNENIAQKSYNLDVEKLRIQNNIQANIRSGNSNLTRYLQSQLNLNEAAKNQSLQQSKLNQESVSNIEDQIRFNQQILTDKANQLDLTQQVSQKEESIHNVEKNRIKSGREIIRLSQQEIGNLKTANSIYTTNESVVKRIEKSQKNSLGIYDKLKDAQEEVHEISNNLLRINSQNIDDETKLKELSKEKNSFEKSSNNAAAIANKVRKVSLFELKGLYQGIRDLNEEIATLSNTPGNQKVIDNLNQQISLLQQETAIHEQQLSQSKSIIKTNERLLYKYEDEVEELEKQIQHSKSIASLTKEISNITDQSRKIQDDISEQAEKQLAYRDKHNILAKGILELEKKQEEAKEKADKYQLGIEFKRRSLAKDKYDLEKKGLTLKEEISELEYDSYRLEQAKKTADSTTIASLQKKIEANDKLISSKQEERDLAEEEINRLSRVNTFIEEFANKVKSANQASLDQQQAIIKELKEQTVLGDNALKNSQNLVNSSNDFIASIDKRKGLLGGVSALEQEIYNTITKQKGISQEVIDNNEKYLKKQIDSKKINETIKLSGDNIVANIKEIAQLEKELGQEKLNAETKIQSLTQQGANITKEIEDLKKEEAKIQFDIQANIRAGNVNLARQLQLQLNLNKAALQQKTSQGSQQQTDLTNQIKAQEDIIKGIESTEDSLKKVVKAHEKELFYLHEELRLKRNIESLDAAKKKAQPDNKVNTANIEGIQNSERLLDSSNDLLNSISERKKLLKEISAEEQLYNATIKQQQRVSQDISANAEKYLGYQIKSKDLKKQINAAEDNAVKSQHAFGKIQNNVTKQYQDSLKASSELIEQIDKENKINLQLNVEVDARRRILDNLINKQLNGEKVSKRTFNNAKNELSIALDRVKTSDKELKNLTEEQQKQENIAKTSAKVIKEGKEILKAQEKEIKFLKENEKTRKRIEKSTGLLGGMSKALAKVPGIGQYLNADEAIEEMEKMAAKIEEAGGRSTSFGNRLKIALKGASVLAKGLYDNLKSPEAIFTFILSKAFQANTQVVALGKSLGYGVGRADAFREKLVGIERSSKNLNVNTTNLVEAFGQLSQATGLSYEFTADQLETQIKLTKQVGLTAEEAAQIQRFAVLNGKTSEETYKSFVKGLTATRNQLKVGINFKAALAEAANVSGQLAANLGNNPEMIARAVVTAKAFGMTLDQVAKSGDSLLSFESSISNELQAELLTGKELNLERARAAALAGDQITLAEELAKNMGTAAEFTRMNRLQQNALAQSVGMTTDELANTLRKREEALASGKSLVQIQEEEVRQALERQSIQDKFGAAVLKLQELIGNLVAGPLGSFLDVLSGALNIVNDMAGPLKVVAAIFGTIFGLSKAIAITEGISAAIAGRKVGFAAAEVSYKSFANILSIKDNALAAIGLATQGSKLSFQQLGLALEGESFAVKTVAYGLALKDLIVERTKALLSRMGLLSITGQIAKYPALLAVKGTEAALSTETALATTATASALSFGGAAVAIIAGIAAVMGALAAYSMKDGEIDPDKGPILTGGFGTVQLDKKDKLMYGADGNIKVGTDLLNDKKTKSNIQPPAPVDNKITKLSIQPPTPIVDNNEVTKSNIQSPAPIPNDENLKPNIQASVLKNTSAQRPQIDVNMLVTSINDLKQATIQSNKQIEQATLASANKPAVINGKSAFVKDTFNEANKTAYKFA